MQQDIWARSYWVPLQARSLPMGAAIGGRHTVTGVTTTPTRERTVAHITEVMVIIIQRLTMILLRELTDGNRLLMGRTGRQRAAPVTILTPALMREALQSRHLMAAEVRHRPTIRTPELMLRPDRDRAQTLSGVAPTSREETRVPPWATTRRPMERWQAPLIRREEKWPLLARSGETPQQVKPPAVICMPDTMATFTRTRVTAGRSTITEAGTQLISLSLTGKGQKITNNGQGARVISSGRQQRVAPIDPAARAASTVQEEAVSIGPAVEADPVIWTARLRTDHVAIFQASVFRDFRAAALIASAAAGVEASAVIAAVAVVDLAVIASVAAGDLGVVALAALEDSVAADLGADAEN